jgi:hypothetical protein
VDRVGEIRGFGVSTRKSLIFVNRHVFSHWFNRKVGNEDKEIFNGIAVAVVRHIDPASWFELFRMRGAAKSE